MFRGRARVTAAAVAAVLDAVADGTGVVAVVGPSGAGKSSLVRAGLVPALTSPGQPLAGHDVVVVTPGPDGAALSDALAAARAGGASPTLLVVDQVEEVFALDPAAARPLLGRLGASDPDRPRGLVVVLVLRADFFSRAAAEPALLPVLAAHQVVVGPMDSAELREAVVEPARRRGRELDGDLVDALLVDLGPGGAAPDAGVLPLLSHALRATWDRAGERLTLADYRATGSLAGAVGQTAERVHDGLDDDERATARWVFLRLVSLSGDLVTRRTATPAELDDATGTAQRVVGRFAAARLLTLGDDTVSVSHEALLVAWPRLRGWVDGYRDDARTHRRIADAAALWESTGRAPEYLLRGGRQAAVAEWVQAPERAGLLNAPERDLLAASARQRAAEEAVVRRRSRRLVRLTAAAVVFGVLALVLALVAALAVGRADRQQAAAVRARDAAVGVQLAVRAAALRDRDPNLAAQLAVAAYRTDPATPARSALLDTTAGVVPARAVGAEGSMAVALTRDGSRVAVARADGSVAVDRLDPTTGVPAELGRTSADTGDPALYATALDPTGRVLAVAGKGATVRLLDLVDPTTPRPLGAGLTGPTSTVRGLAWEPGPGGVLAAASADGQVHRWRVDLGTGSGTELPPVVETGPLNAVAASPDGRLLATGASDGTAKIWDVAPTPTGSDRVPALLATVPTSTSTSFVLSLTFSPDGRRLAVGGKDRVVREVDVTDPRDPVVAPRVLEGPTSYVNGICYSADGTRLVAASSDNRARVFDLATGAVTATLPAPAALTQALFLPGDRSVVTASVDGVLRTWPLGEGPLEGARDSVFNAAFSGDGRVLVVGPNAADGRVLLWDMRAPGGPRRLGADLVPPEGVRLDSSVSVRRDGALVASGTATGSLVLWDVTDPAAPRVLGPPTETGLGLVQNTDVSPDGRFVVAGVDPGVLVVWDVTDPTLPRETARVPVGDVVLDVEVSPDGSTVAATAGDGTVRRFDLAADGTVREGPELSGFSSTASSLAFSPDSSRLAAGSYDRTVAVWDVADRARPRLVARLDGPAGGVIGTAYAPDGRTVAGASEDGSVWLWDVPPGAGADGARVVATLGGAGDRVFTAPFDPAGGSVVGFGAGAAQSGRVWDTDPDAAVAQVCAGVGTPITEAEWASYAVGVPYAPPCG